MARPDERRLLQGAVALAAAVPILAGGAGVATGGAFLTGVEPPLATDLDSHMRYLSGLLLGIGLAFLAAIPRIERNGVIFAGLGAIVVVGGLGRLLSLAVAGVPGPGHLFGLAMELAVVPALVLWQRRIAAARSGG
ncbi:MAG: DUF4345 domain-containing protein [Allosphingosinicella sp.]|uniref:DUF4345 domain-containing protein n=1 Tax=Allosphingosinicella sp. TaxID=2823234 RepID=UPI003920E0C7